MNRQQLLDDLHKLSKQSVDGYSEPHVEELITKLISILGYELEDYDTKKKQPGGSGKPDYTLKKSPQIPIEVKDANNPLGHDEIDQIKGYSYDLHANLAVLTNGRLFHFYSPFWKRRKSFAECLIWTCALKDLGDLKTAEKFLSLLHKDISSEQLNTTIDTLEEEIVEEEKRVSGIKDSLSALNQERQNIETEYPDIRQLANLMPERLDTDIRTVVAKYNDLCIRIAELGKEPLPTNQVATHSGGNIQTTRTTLRRTNARNGGIFLPVEALDDMNYHGLTTGKQILVLSVRANAPSQGFIVLWQKKHPSGFEYSTVGASLKRQIPEFSGSSYITHVEIFKYENNLEMWEKIVNEPDLFPFWNAKHGPYERGGNLLVCRVYQIDYTINVSCVGGGQTTRAIKNSSVIDEIEKSIERKTPVIGNADFATRRAKLLQIMEPYLR